MGARALVHGNVPGGGRTNRQHFGADADLVPGLDPEVADLLFDPQTSGGLLVAVAADVAGEASAALRQAGCLGAVIGDVVPQSAYRLVVG